MSLAMQPSTSGEVVIPRPASTVLLVRNGAEGLEVFMVVRHHKIDFASGALVFPGGKVDPADYAIPAPGDYEEADRVSRIAALRETFEECGVLLARGKGETQLIDGARKSRIAATWAGKPFAEMLEGEGLEPALDVLTPYAHWITPPILPKRFDTRFYIVAAPDDQVAAHDGSESVDSVWISPARVLAEAAQGKYVLVLATRLNVELLAHSHDVAGAIGASAARRIVPVEPVAIKTEKGHRLTIPIEAGYGASEFEV